MNPSLVAYGALGLSIAFELVGTTFLMKSQQFSRLVPTLIMAVCYVSSFFFLSQALKTVPLGFAYAMWGGLGIVCTAIVGVVVFRQTLDLPALLGIGLIVSGVVVLNAFSSSAGH